MRELKILHISDLLLGRPENDDAFATIATQLAGKLRDVDYIVITGNVTADGQPKSFAAAEQALNDLAERLLRRDKDGIRRNRVLIVPGRRDTQNGDSYSAFKDFHDRFFASEIDAERPRVERFDPEKAAFRQLNNITLIGLCSWKNRPEDRIQTTLVKLAPAIREAADRLVQIPYTEQTPTIIASADSIAFRGDSRDHASFHALRAALRGSFMKSVHLFGADSMLSLPSLFTLDSIGLGTGSKSGGFWPFVANFLTIRRRSVEDRDQLEQPLLSNTVYHQAGAELFLDDSDRFQEHLDLFYKPDPAFTRDSMYESLLRSIETAFRDNPHVIVRGLPGAGKLSFYEFMKKRDHLVDQKVQVIARRLRRPIDEELINGIQREIDDFRKSCSDHEVMPLVLLHDGFRATMPIEGKSDRLRPLSSIFTNDVYVIVLRPEDGITDVSAPLRDRERVLPFPRLEIDGVQGLVREYSCCAPAEKSLVHKVSGGYAGFSELILQETAEALRSESGAEPMREGTPSRMIDRAVYAPRVQEEARRHLDSLKRKAEGPIICEYIREKVQQKRAASGVSVAQLSPIDIVVDDLKERARSSPLTKLLSLEQTLEELSEAGILSPKETRNGHTTYRVEVLAPFVAKVERRTQERWPEVTDADLVKPVDIVIITALTEERDALLRKFPNRQQVDATDEDTLVYHFAKVPITYPSGKKGQYRVVVTSLLQIGQTDGAIAATKAIDRWDPRGVLLVGIAGGVKSNDVSIGDILVADTVAYYDDQSIRAAGAQIRWRMIPTDPLFLGAAQNFTADAAADWFDLERPGDGVPKLHVGPVATGSKVIATEELLKEYKETHPKLVGVEMEAWGVATAAFQAGRPRRFFMIRGVSDLADMAKDSREVDAWRPYACDAAAAYTVALLQSGPLADASHQEGVGR
jgi:nucleoside phosphorylase